MHEFIVSLKMQNISRNYNYKNENINGYRDDRGKIMDLTKRISG